jgi:hypothetical protein
MTLDPERLVCLPRRTGAPIALPETGLTSTRPAPAEIWLLSAWLVV